MLLAVASLAFVVVYMAVHTGSCCLSICGMLHILMSFPLAFIVYTFFFNIESFYVLSFMSVFVILAIGADDVSFVTCSAKYTHAYNALTM